MRSPSQGVPQCGNYDASLSSPVPAGDRGKPPGAGRGASAHGDPAGSAARPLSDSAAERDGGSDPSSIGARDHTTSRCRPRGYSSHTRSGGSRDERVDSPWPSGLDFLTVSLDTEGSQGRHPQASTGGGSGWKSTAVPRCFLPRILSPQSRQPAPWCALARDDDSAPESLIVGARRPLPRPRR